VNTFSKIQNEIISKLKNHKSLTYAKIWNKKIPNDLFNYHLQFLVKKGILDKVKSEYSLSDKGKKLVADPYVAEELGNIFFKFNVVMILVRKNKGKIEILNQIRKSQPSYGKKGVPGGVVRKGESVEEAASRKMKTETGLEAKFKIIGIVRRHLIVDGELFADMFFPIAYSNKFSGELIKNSEYGENVWVNIDEAIKNESAKFDSIVALPKVLRAIKGGKISKIPFFYIENTQSGRF